MSERYFPEFSDALARVLPELKGKKVAVIGHIRPDGDCIGSQVAFTRILKAHGIQAIALNQHAIPFNLREFIGDTPFLSDTSTPPSDFDYCVSVDCSATNRMGSAIMERFPKIDFCIDHHISNNGFAAVNCIDAHAAATAEIIAGMAMDCQLPIDPVSAQALFVGIATDTGQFRYAATSERVFELTAALLRLGADAHAAAHELYERESEGRIHLLQRFLETLESHMDGQLVFGKITQSMLAETGTRREETEGFIDYARNIDSVKIAALLEEQKDGTVKGSLRSKFSKYQVDQLAARFNGGGHACAAGFHMTEPFITFPATFISAVQQHLTTISD